MILFLMFINEGVITQNLYTTIDKKSSLDFNAITFDHQRPTLNLVDILCVVCTPDINFLAEE